MSWKQNCDAYSEDIPARVHIFTDHQGAIHVMVWVKPDNEPEYWLRPFAVVEGGHGRCTPYMGLHVGPNYEHTSLRKWALKRANSKRTS